MTAELLKTAPPSVPLREPEEHGTPTTSSILPEAENSRHALRMLRSTTPGASSYLAITDQMRLPPELLVECFSWLTLPDRVRVSSVSTVWRAVALAFPKIWSTIKMRLENAQDIAMLTTILRRTGMHTLDLNLRVCSRRSNGSVLLQTNFAHFEGLLTILNEVNDRIGSFVLRGRLQDLPLSLHHLQGSVQGTAGSRLRKLDLLWFSFGDVVAPFNNLVWFKGHVLRKDLSGFLKFCPNLIHLELIGDVFTVLKILPSIHIPRSLTELVLDIDRDLSDYLRTYWAQQSLRSLTIKRGIRQIDTALEIFPALNFVIHTLKIRASHFQFIGVDQRRLIVHVRSVTDQLGLHSNRLEPRLQALRSLHMHRNFHALLRASFALPLLEELVLEDAGMPPGPVEDYAKLNVPALQTLSLRYTASGAQSSSTQDFIAQLPDLWAQFIQPAGLRIHALVFGPRGKPHFVKALDALDFSRAADFTDGVYIAKDLLFCAVSSKKPVVPAQ